MKVQASAKCREHQILHGRLRADMKVYADTTQRLESCRPEDFQKTYEAAEYARTAFLDAREALRAHVAVHRCEQAMDLLDFLKAIAQ